MKEALKQAWLLLTLDMPAFYNGCRLCDMTVSQHELFHVITVWLHSMQVCLAWRHLSSALNSHGHVPLAGMPACATTGVCLANTSCTHAAAQVHLNKRQCIATQLPVDANVHDK